MIRRWYTSDLGLHQTKIRHAPAIKVIIKINKEDIMPTSNTITGIGKTDVSANGEVHRIR